MSSTSLEVPVETGSHSDFKVWDVNSLAEPIMRTWQLSEALSRIAKRIQKRYPEEAKILRASSEDIVHCFFMDMRQKQEEFLKHSKIAEADSGKGADEKQRKARLEKQMGDVGATKNDGETTATTVLGNSEDSSSS